MTEDAEQVQRTLAVATDVVNKLMMACGEGNAQAGAYVVRQVFDAQNPDLLMLVLGRLVTRLTAAERRVAGLAADGLTNRAIARRLFLTLRTVETHLTHTYAKLGVDRRGLVDALGEDGPRDAG